MEALGFSFAFLAVTLGAFKCASDGIKTGVYVSCFSLFFLFEAIDLLIPGMLIIAFDMNSYSPFQPLFTSSEKAEALLVSSASFFIFWIGYSVVKTEFRGRITQRPIRVNVKKLLNLNLFFGFLVIVYFADLISSSGGVGSYIESMSKWRYSRLYDEKSLFETLLGVVGSIAKFTSFALVSSLYCFRDSVKRKWIVYAAILFSILVCLATFYRGTLLLFVLMLASAEQFRLNNIINRKNGSFVRRGSFKKIFGMGILGITVFTIFGAVRTILGSNANSGDVLTGSDAVATEMGRLIGHGGFYSLTHILSTFENYNLLYGESIIATLFYRVIPRFFWESKPVNYRAFDINVVLGYPHTTQAAVTIPGELFANFGYLGILIGMLIVGYLLAKFQKLSTHSELKFFHANTVASLIIAIGWFSATGFSSWLYSVFVLFYVYKSRFNFLSRN